MLEEGDAWKNVGAVYGMQSPWTRKNGLRKSLSVSEKNVCFWFEKRRKGRQTRTEHRKRHARHGSCGSGGRNCVGCSGDESFLGYASRKDDKGVLGGLVARCFLPVAASRTSLAPLQHGEGQGDHPLLLGLLFLYLVP